MIVTVRCPELNVKHSGRQFNRELDVIVNFEDNHPQEIMCGSFEEERQRCAITDRKCVFSYWKSFSLEDET